LQGSVAEDLPAMQAILESEEWQSLQNKLFEYVTNFNSKIVQATSRFQLL
jgi:ABC-type enterochelin transport system permease subunit